jgi:hypothetical protein
MPDFRARCDQLVQAIDKYPVKPKAHRDLCNEVRAELEKFKPPTDDELFELATKTGLVGQIAIAAATHPEKVDQGLVTGLANDAAIVFARAVLKRWGGTA